MIRNVTIIGTGLIGASVALGLRAAGFAGTLTGIDRSETDRALALETRAFDEVLLDRGGSSLPPIQSDLILLATPVLAILDWMERLSPVLSPVQLVTDVGSTKLAIATRAASLFNGPGQAAFLPGHPMAGKESGGAALAEATLFSGARWLFTPVAPETELTGEWRQWVERLGARVRDLDPARHDEVCAWVSHLPQFLATALAAVLEHRFGDDPDAVAIGGRALSEMTRLGASPFSMWRDVAMTNTPAVAASLRSLEQELTHLRDKLKTAELREEFALANSFCQRRGR